MITRNGRAALAAWAASSAALAGALALGGCLDGRAVSADASIAETQGGAARFVWYRSDGNPSGNLSAEMFVLQDGETGVRYLVLFDTRGKGLAVTTLLNADGTPCMDPEHERPIVYDKEEL